MLTLRFEENNLNTANLHLKEGRAAKISTLSPTVVSITGMFEPERQRVKDFIKNIYKQSYNADINVDYPILMSIRDENDDILAAVGFRYAAHEELFLERYTDAPIDNILNCSRNEIVEIGNLASAGHGASAFLFAALASYLDNKNIHYAAITGTDFLHRYFKRAGLNPRKICDADITAVQDDMKSWGSYYDTQPRVLIGAVGMGVKRLKATLGAKFEDCRPRMFPRLHHNKKGKR